MKPYYILVLFFMACSKPKQASINRFSDEALIQIYELQDRRETKQLFPYLKAKKEEHRIAAALAFASIQDTTAIPYLNQMLQIDQDPMPRRAAAFALGQIGKSSALNILKTAFDGELYNPNRRYILEAIGKCGDSSTLSVFEKNNYTDSAIRLGWIYGVLRMGQKGFYSKSINNRVIHMLNDPSMSVALVAGAFTRKLITTKQYSPDIDSLIQNLRYPELQLQFDYKPKSVLIDFDHSFLETYEKLDPYEKVSKIQQLNAGNFQQFLFSEIQSRSSHVMVKNEAFRKYCDTYAEDRWNIIKKILSDSNMALTSLASNQIEDISEVDSIDPDLRDELFKLCNYAIKKLELPRQAETYIDLTKAINHLDPTSNLSFSPQYNHPIDWTYVKMIPNNQKVVIITTQGEITLELFVDDAPGTVSNFLKLVDAQFYNNKYFHRVVPNFVIQGGCPRGDGWGSLNWSQRSEFSNYKTYQTGTVGIASSGKDTEGVQFFITHCPTPHLDGRYTIFAQVIDGLEIIQKITIGDQILSVRKLP